MKRVLLILSLFTYLTVAKSQGVLLRTCGFDDHIHQSIQQNPHFMDEVMEDVDDMYNNLARMVDDTTEYTVRVVFHIIYLADNKYENVPDEFCFNQIDALNRDYNLLNDDTINLRSEFRKFLGNARIKFQLATEDPNGNPTNGIERKLGNLNGKPGWGLAANILQPQKADDHKYTNKGGLDAWDTKKYLNIWVVDLNVPTRGCDTCGYLGGYAYFPPNNPAATPDNDGPTIDYRFFGQGNHYLVDSLNNSPNYAKGRTTVHECGHYFGLFHCWGALGQLNPALGCLDDDNILDTPNSTVPYATHYVEARNVCDTIVNSCDTKYQGVDYDDLFEDYMDYSTDKCYSIFTKQQVAMMRKKLTEKRPGLIISTPTGVTQVSAANNNIDLFPNPSTGKVFVRQNAGFKSDVQVKVYNLMGEIVYQKTISAAEKNFDIDLSGKAASIYMINFTADGITTSEKIILE